MRTSFLQKKNHFLLREFSYVKETILVHIALFRIQFYKKNKQIKHCLNLFKIKHRELSLLF